MKKRKLLILVLIISILFVSTLFSRYYDTELSKFITADSVTPGGGYNPQGLNRYSYCFNNPVKYVDPTGNDPMMKEYINVGLRNMIPMVYERMGISGVINTFTFALPFAMEINRAHGADGLTSYRKLAFGYLTALSMGTCDASVLHSIIPAAQFKTASEGNSTLKGALTYTYVPRAETR